VEGEEVKVEHERNRCEEMREKVTGRRKDARNRMRTHYERAAGVKETENGADGGGGRVKEGVEAI